MARSHTYNPSNGYLTELTPFSEFLLLLIIDVLFAIPLQLELLHASLLLLAKTVCFSEDGLRVKTLREVWLWPSSNRIVITIKLPVIS